VALDRPCRLALVTGLMVAALAALSPAAGAASPTACRVRNVETGAVKSSLAAAVVAATAGQRLRVKGTCHGVTQIDRDLVITGVRTKASGVPTLDGDDLDSVVQVFPSTVVTIRDLRIVDGTAASGGGIINSGSLTLRSVRIAGNRTTTDGTGAGIHNAGALLLIDTTLVDNRAPGPSSTGGGVHNAGAATFRGTSLVRGNRAALGGGLHNTAAATLFDSSTITANIAWQQGGGVYNTSAFSAFDTSAITENRAGGDGGGLYNTGAFSLLGGSVLRRNTSSTPVVGIGGIFSTGDVSAVCVPPRVRNNTPVNCSS
jgi:hypothetical protein